MTRGTTSSAIREVESLFDGGSLTALSDRQLIERFIAARDRAGEAAFSALVGRHGPMVLGVCRQVVGDDHHAEDAFQAVFLVLARRARSIRQPELLSNWLYGVALRTACKARTRLKRYRGDEEILAINSARTRAADQPAIDREQIEALHEEIARLPATSRVPVVLCYFEGLSLAETAARIHCPPGTVHSRLARARDRLRRGLARRGVALSAGALAAASTPRSASASISARVCDSTARTAIAFKTGGATGGATLASALAEEILGALLIGNLRQFVLTPIVAIAIATGAGLLARWTAIQEGTVKGEKSQRERIMPRTALQDGAQGVAATAKAGRMTVTGSVVGPDGKPAAGALVDVVGRLREPWVATKVNIESYVLIGQGQTDADGRFRFDAARTASGRFFEVDAFAAMPGYGIGYFRLNLDADEPSAQVVLKPEQVIHGRLVDINGQPAAGVKVSIGQIGRFVGGTFEGVNLGDTAPLAGLRAWPRTVETDDRGRFVLTGIGRNTRAGLIVRDHRFAQQWLSIDTGDRPGPNEMTLALQPATTIEGRVVADDTGQPVANATIAISASRDEMGSMYNTRFRADGDGRFVANPSPGSYFRITAAAPEGQHYLVPRTEFAWTKGTVKRTVDVRLPRGVVIQGVVTEDKTGRPLAGASVQFVPTRPSSRAVYGWESVVASAEDGSFQIAVPEGTGRLFVFGPTPDYVLEAIGSRVLHLGQPGGNRRYAHKIIPYDVKLGERPAPIVAKLRRGATVKGRMIGPNGQNVDQAKIIATLHVNYFHIGWRGDITIHARDGRFELHGLDSEKATRVSFLDADHEWGTTVELSGKQAAEDVTVQLETCGQAKARFVGPDGKPVVGVSSFLEILGTPGPSIDARDPNEQALLAADSTSVSNLDRKHYANGLRTDSEGRITLPDLIPGALYRISDHSDRDKQGILVRKDFTIGPGETLDLGDILIEKPDR
jgi:RNA polymerase sigma factor (sigma-70 family)